MNKVVIIATVVLLATIGLSAYAYTSYLPSIYGNSSTGQPGTTSLGGSGSGTINFYLTDSPHTNATVKYLLVNVTSITLEYATGSEPSTTITATSTSSSASSTSSSSSSSSTSSASTVSSSSSSSSTSIGSTTSTSSSATSTAPAEFVYQVPASVGTNVNITRLQGSALLLGASKVPAGNVTGIVLNITGAKAFWTDGSSNVLKVVANGKLMADIHFQVFPNGTTNLTVDITPGGIHISPGNDKVLRPVIMVTAEGQGTSGGAQTTTQTTLTESESSTSTTS